MNFILKKNNNKKTWLSTGSQKVHLKIYPSILYQEPLAVGLTPDRYGEKSNITDFFSTSYSSQYSLTFSFSGIPLKKFNICISVLSSHLGEKENVLGILVMLIAQSYIHFFFS